MIKQISENVYEVRTNGKVAYFEFLTEARLFLLNEN